MCEIRSPWLLQGPRDYSYEFLRGINLSFDDLLLSEHATRAYIYIRDTVAHYCTPRRRRGGENKGGEKKERKIACF